MSIATNSWGRYPQNDYRSYLEHHGILGMRWGVRRYQNSDGSLTKAGKKRYGASDKESSKSRNSKTSKLASASERLKRFSSVAKQKLSDPRTQKAIKAGAIVLGTAALAYGGYKLNKKIDLENLKFAKVAGTNFANRFVDMNHPLNQGTGSMAAGRYFNAVTKGQELRGPLSTKIAEDIYDSRGKLGSIKRVKQYRDILKGKKAFDDVLDYKGILDKALDDTKWEEGGRYGSSKLAELLYYYNMLGGGRVSSFREMKMNKR